MEVAELAHRRVGHVRRVPGPVEAARDRLARLLAVGGVVLQVEAAARQDGGAGVGEVGHAAVGVLACGAVIPGLKTCWLPLASLK